ncbi:hypothetical protein, partial [Aureimonas sp. Leaf460]|uniref:hypothetical protein n=2 Tax=unclassified Aureimonas TaxID=2615206 RepID=UPI001AEBAC02
HARKLIMQTTQTPRSSSDAYAANGPFHHLSRSGHLLCDLFARAVRFRHNVPRTAYRRVIVFVIHSWQAVTMSNAFFYILETIINGFPPGGMKPSPRMAIANKIANYLALGLVAAVGVWIAYAAIS